METTEPVGICVILDEDTIILGRDKKTGTVEHNHSLSPQNAKGITCGGQKQRLIYQTAFRRRATRGRGGDGRTGWWYESTGGDAYNKRQQFPLLFSPHLGPTQTLRPSASLVQTRYTTSEWKPTPSAECCVPTLSPSGQWCVHTSAPAQFSQPTNKDPRRVTRHIAAPSAAAAAYLGLPRLGTVSHWLPRSRPGRRAALRLTCLTSVRQPVNTMEVIHWCTLVVPLPRSMITGPAPLLDVTLHLVRIK
ncbi:hypothetical protein FB45DRAFT_1014854 [Roridomyces roridus]|uniref:Uncharacterized protein n=1 Tax=Roridomyces roridus TaxID=1738132 RepID=A0AAD7AXC6_9AGAR|nr:hypothetical protein FB45DRAFT_1014854 [Roridomyces roridus]